MSARTSTFVAFVLATAWANLACTSTDDALLTYAPCTANMACDLGTVCTHVPSVMDASTAALCTQGCATDNDCPGLDALCIVTQGDAGVCYRSCEPGCRPGTVCVQSAAGGRGACMP